MAKTHWFCLGHMNGAPIAADQPTSIAATQAIRHLSGCVLIIFIAALVHALQPYFPP